LILDAPANSRWDTMSKVYLSRTQAAKRVGRCAKTLRNLAKRGEGPPFIMIGTSRPAYPDDELHTWIAAGGDAQ
jgi:predicted DNA-binding transcriptional regulator AlpA